MKYVKVEFKVPVTSTVGELKSLIQRVERALIGQEKVKDIRISAVTDDLNEFMPKGGKTPKIAGQHQ